MWLGLLCGATVACLQPVDDHAPEAAPAAPVTQPSTDDEQPAQPQPVDAGIHRPDAGAPDAGCCGQNTLLLFGGLLPNPNVGGGTGSNTTFAIDVGRGQLTEVQVAGTKPPPRSHHLSAWDDARKRMLIFGGLVDREVWALEFNHARPTWVHVAVHGFPPPAREFACGAWDAASGRWYVGFGQGGPNHLLSDLWVFDATTDTWTSLASGGPTPRQVAAMAFDTATGTLVLSGGQDEHDQVLPDLWQFDPVQQVWSTLTATPSPGAIAWHQFVPGLSPLVVVGGVDGAHLRFPRVLALAAQPPAAWLQLEAAPNEVQGFLDPVGTLDGVAWVWSHDRLWSYRRGSGWTSRSLTGAPTWLEGYSAVGAKN